MKDPYVKIYFGGQQFRTAVCRDGSKHPSWNDVFTFNPSGDSSMRIEVWDLDSVNDDLIGEGSYNLMKIYNMPSMRSDNGSYLLI
jgi:Ca2+-dependent lipid-binding protein